MGVVNALRVLRDGPLLARFERLQPEVMEHSSSVPLGQSIWMNQQ
jgi:hypothetical protein